MKYIEDQATGVTVGRSRDGCSTVVTPRSGDVHLYTDAEADALLRGLLRWKLEQTKSTAEVLEILNQERKYWSW